MGSQIKQTIDLFVEGKKKRLRGVTKYTTCDDIIKMVIHKTASGTADATSFAVFESREGVERILSRKDNVLKLVRSWGSDASKSDIVVRRLGDVRSKIGRINDKKKRLTRFRSQLFSAVQNKNDAFIDEDKSECSGGSKDYSNSSRQCLLADGHHSRLYKQKNSKFISKHASGVKLSVFRKIFRGILKNNHLATQDTGKKPKRQNCAKMHKDNYINGGIRTESNFELSMNSFQACHVDNLNESDTLDKAFIDDSEYLNLEITHNSVFNQCIIEDSAENIEEMTEPDDEYTYISDLEKNIEADEYNILVVEQSFVKLNQIKKLFELNDTHCRSEDDFMESFMRTKLYELESDGDM